MLAADKEFFKTWHVLTLFIHEIKQNLFCKVMKKNLSCKVCGHPVMLFHILGRHFSWVQIRKILWYGGFKFIVKWNQIWVFARKFFVFFQIYGKTTWNLWYLGSRDLHYLNPCDGSHIFEAQNDTFLMKKSYPKAPIWRKIALWPIKA